ncbi:hypothetical protein BRARA_F02681 [Brassica rapa]|uniref:Cytochrome P450 n=1 Tax=Brassica campestris TaxID=3711 RepID=A0A397Z1X3_BRACM|nr:hypothetical protein BRARA_F02681 [Brassica rapa]
MEMMLISVCLAIFLAFLFLKPLFTRTTTTTKLKLPPSPWRLPLIGNLYQLSLHPHRSLHSLSLRYGPLMLLHFGCVPTIVVSSADVAHDVLKTHDLNFSNRPRTRTVEKLFKGTEIAFVPYGEYWRQMKLIYLQLLGMHAEYLRYESPYQQNDSILREYRAEEINLLMGKLEKASSSSSPDMFFGAAPTTFTLLEWTMTELLRHPECMKKLKDEICSVSTHNLYVTEQEAEKINYLNLLVKEVLINIWAIQRDVSAWGQDAEELRPGRHLDTVVDFQGQNLKFIPFGSGRRQCPGSGYVVALVEVTLANLPPVGGGLTENGMCKTDSSGREPSEEVLRVIFPITTLKKLTGLRVRKAPSNKLETGCIATVVVAGPDPKTSNGYSTIRSRADMEEQMVNDQYVMVLINIWAIQRDVSAWGQDADEFRPDKHLDMVADFQGQNLKFIPFGSGRRICPGMKRFDWKVDVGAMGDDKPDVAEANGIDVCRKYPLIVCPSSA